MARLPSPRRQALWATLGLLVAALPPLGSAGYALWVRKLRRPPPPQRRSLAPGLRYRRLVSGSPARVTHVIEVALDTPGLRLRATRPRAHGLYRAETPSSFLRRRGLAVAINGDFFTPWFARGPWAYYPYGGDRVALLGRRARIVDRREKALSLDQSTLHFGCGARPTFRPGERRAAEPRPCRKLHGLPLLRRGEARVPAEPFLLHPRSALAIDREARRLWLVVIDGRQPGHSVGASLMQLATLLRELGAYDALLLDGGGSSALVARGADGAPELLSRPIHGRVVGWERPVANCLGVELRDVERRRSSRAVQRN